MTDRFNPGDRVRFKLGADLNRHENIARQQKRVEGTVQPSLSRDPQSTSRVRFDDGKEQAVYSEKLELVSTSSIRAKTLTSLKADRLAKLRNIGTNQTTVEELNDKIERDTAVVQELDDLIRDIEKPAEEEHALKIGDKVRHKSTNQKATILNFEGSNLEVVVVRADSSNHEFRWWIKNTFKR